MQSSIALEQLRAKHLPPAHSLTVSQILHITEWTPHPLSLIQPSAHDLHALIHAAPNSAAAHDGIPMEALKLLTPEQCQPLASLLVAGLQGANVAFLPQATFFAIPKKQGLSPFLSDARPIVNLTATAKLLTTWIRSILRPHCLQHGYVPPQQFALQPRTSPPDLLRVLHDLALDAWANGKPFYAILDDVTHAFGSPSHTTLINLLLSIGCPDHLCHLISSQMTDLRITTRSPDPEASIDTLATTLHAGVGQGASWSSDLFALSWSLRHAYLRTAIPNLDTPMGPLNSVAWSDDTVWLPSDQATTQQSLTALSNTSATNLNSEPVKVAIIAAAASAAGPITLPATYHMGHTIITPNTSSSYTRLLGRHALPGFHRQELTHLLSHLHKASAALSRLQLPVITCLQLYSAKAGGLLNWYGHVSPPPWRAALLADIPPTEPIRAVGHFLPTPAPTLTTAIEDGGTGLEPAALCIYHTFFCTYFKQLNHPHALTRQSTRHGLFHLQSHQLPPLPTHALPGLKSYTTDHSLFVHLLESLGWTLSHPPSYISPFLHPTLQPYSLAPIPDLVLPISSPHILIFHDASFDPSTHHAAGALAVYDCIHHTTHQLPIPIPIPLDSSYQAELWTAWQTLLALTTAPCGPTLIHRLHRDEPVTYTDCHSYISALSSANQSSSVLTTFLLAQCRSLLSIHQLPTPSHIHSHRDITFYDHLLAIADTLANATRVSHPPTGGWSPTLPGEPFLLMKGAITYHQPPAALRSDIRSWYTTNTHGSLPSTPAPYAMYKLLCTSPNYPWEDHLQTVAIRLELWSPRHPSCPLGSPEAHPYHPIWSCPLAYAYRFLHLAYLQPIIAQLYPAPAITTPTHMGLLVLPHRLLIDVAQTAIPPQAFQFTPLVGLTRHTFGHTGGVHRDTLQSLNLQPRHPLLRPLLTAIVRTTLWFHRRHSFPQPPPMQRLQHLNVDLAWQFLQQHPKPSLPLLPSPSTHTSWPDPVLLGSLAAQLHLSLLVHPVFRFPSTIQRRTHLYIFACAPSLSLSSRMPPLESAITDTQQPHPLSQWPRLWTLSYAHADPRYITYHQTPDSTASLMSILHLREAFFTALRLSGCQPKPVFLDYRLALCGTAPT